MVGHGLARMLNWFGYRPRWAKNYLKRVVEEETPAWRPRHKRSPSLERHMRSRVETNGGMPMLSRGPTKEKSTDDSNVASLREGNVQIDTQMGELSARAMPEKPNSPHRPSASTILFDDR
jgi:hypothetical protein